MLDAGRGRAESRMTEGVYVFSFLETTDPITGNPSMAPVADRYDSIGRIKYESLAVSERDGASSPVATQTPLLSVPTGSPVFYEGDGVIVRSSSVDDSLAGRTYTIAGSPQAGQTTSLRYPLEERS